MYPTRELIRLAAVPLGLLAARHRFPGLKLLRQAVRWGPLALGAARLMGSLVTRRRSS
jgi:hypothetical protein